MGLRYTQENLRVAQRMDTVSNEMIKEFLENYIKKKLEMNIIINAPTVFIPSTKIMMVLTHILPRVL